jgi:dipeptidyl aminopeptidase/acylaminoacyl peptidase
MRKTAAIIAKTLARFAILAILALHASAAAAQTQSAPARPPLTIDQGLSLQLAQSPRISPDGRLVAYEVRSTNWEDNTFETEIWIAVTSSGDRFALTHSKRSSGAPRWSPDGKRIAFLSDREGKEQIYLISPAGGEAEQLTHFESGVNAMEWSPDGRRIAFLAADPESKAQKDRREKYGEFTEVKQNEVMSHLWLVEVPSGVVVKMPEPQRLTEGDQFSVNDFSWSPEGERIAFSAPRDSSPASEGTEEIYLVGVEEKKVKKLAAGKGPNHNPIWSPDGKFLAYETANGQEFYYYLNTRIAVIPASGGVPRILSEAFDENPVLLDWRPDGIYFGAEQKTSAHLFRLDPESAKIERLSAPDSLMISSASFTRDFREAAVLAARPNAMAEVSVTRVKPFELRQLTAMGDQLQGVPLPTREVITWKSTDGTPIEGILIKPPGFDSAKKYPLLVVIHGGPTGVSTPEFSLHPFYPIEQFAAKGALILRPNYRGSAGYGEKFRSLNVRNLGVGDVWDVLSGVDALIARGIVDVERLGAMGWSQGGYISAFLTTTSTRFKAISVGAGISDWTTYYVNTDITPFTRQYLHATPWEDPAIYRKTSPISYLKTAKTPTLIQHGDSDHRVPIPNAYELRQALEDRGVPVKMIVYKGFGHQIDKPKQQRAVQEHNLEWFSKWVWGEKAEEIPK